MHSIGCDRSLLHRGMNRSAFALTDLRLYAYGDAWLFG
jgi:hypothetical protein